MRCRPHPLREHAAVVAAAATLALLAAACVKKHAPAAFVVGTVGGTVAIGNAAKLVFPADALAADTTIGIAPHTMAAADADLVPGTAWDFTPDGVHFAKPVQVALRWDPNALPQGTDPSRLALVHLLDDGSRMIADGLSVDLAAHVATGTSTWWSTRRQPWQWHSRARSQPFVPEERESA